MGKHYCIITDVSEACHRAKRPSIDPRVEAKQEKMQDLFPSFETFEAAGNPYSNSSTYYDGCVDFVKKLEEEHGMEVILMHAAATRSEAQAQLSDSAFREFVKKTTNCDIVRVQQPEDSGSFMFSPEPGCLKFMYKGEPGHDEKANKVVWPEKPERVCLDDAEARRADEWEAGGIDRQAHHLYPLCCQKVSINAEAFPPENATRQAAEARPSSCNRIVKAATYSLVLAASAHV